MAPTLVFLPGKFHRQRSLAGYSSRDHKESNMTERLTHTHTHTQYIGQWHSPSSCPPPLPSERLTHTHTHNIGQWHSPSSCPPQLPSLPCVCFLSWRLYSCPANRFICTIFLDSIYIHLYVILVFHRLSWFFYSIVSIYPEIMGVLMLESWEVKGSLSAFIGLFFLVFYEVK